MKDLVTTGWLDAELGAPDLRIADCTWFLPDEGRSARAEFEREHIPGAVFIDLAEIVDTANPAPMMMPRTETFVAKMSRLGIGDGCRLVLYDASPHHTAARAWAMFRSFGVPSVAVLDGGLAKWRGERRPLDHAAPLPSASPLTARDHGIGIVTGEGVAAALRAGTVQVVDARSPSRFAGEEAEPRAGVVPGHMPGARNLHYAQLFRADGTWKQDAELRAAFAAAGIDADEPIIATCGSGVTASAIAFALHLLGRDASIYDGSWAEWGSDPSTPKAIGRG